MNIYADSSVFVSFYVNDIHSQDARRKIEHHPALLLTPLHRAEWANAIAQHVFRKHISEHQAREFYKAFDRDRNTGLWLEVNMPDSAFETCIDLADEHTVRLGTRTLDTLHVASALELGADEFWTFDDRQAKLAKVVGLRVT